MVYSWSFELGALQQNFEVCSLQLEFKLGRLQQELCSRHSATEALK